MSKRVVILGAGESGTGAALLAQKQGFSVFVSESGSIKKGYKDQLQQAVIPFEEGGHSEDLILRSDLVVKSPGIPNENRFVKLLKKNQIPVISEIEFASRYTDAKFIAVTGSNGKTTTTSLIFRILLACGFSVGMGGNIGKSLAMSVLEDGRSGKSFYVVELSSFQLDDVYDFHAHVAVILNITPDHLDRYDNDFSKYADAKLRITRNMTPEDVIIFWEEDYEIKNRLDGLSSPAQVLAFSSTGKSNTHAYLDDKNLIVDGLSISKEILPLRGEHNAMNMMAAISAAIYVGADPKELEKAIVGFKAIEHRMEEVAEVGGVLFINDSKATNVDSVYYALESIDSPIIWIAGGIDKGNDYSKIDHFTRDKVKSLICLGVDNKKLLSTFSGKINRIVESKEMKDAVEKAFDFAEKGDVVLLSPACASFDLFENYERRGDMFKNSVMELKG